MKIITRILSVTLTAALVLTMSVVATTAHAGKRQGDPPFGQRDVIADAAPICALATEPDALGLACKLLADSDGPLVESKGCTGEDPDPTAIVSYSLRNCDNNRDSLMRYAASAVLSIDDWISPGGKVSQMESAASYLCGYADKFMTLEGAGKVAGADLAADAEAIVTDYLWLSCDI